MRLNELEQALINAHKAGDEQGARILAGEIVKKRRSLGMKDDGTYDAPDPTATGSNVMAGIGKGFMDLGRGIGQAVGLVSRDDISESRKTDERLMQTTGGKVGAVIGTAAGLAPTALIPGANTMAGASVIGLGSGMLAPSTSDEETARNTLLGGVLGPAGVVLGRGAGAAYQGGKALIQPFTKKGQEQIAAKALQSFATDPALAAQTLRNAPRPTIGSPTAAEVAMDPGIAQLQRTLMNNPDAARALQARQLQNVQARADALGGIAGDDAARAAAVASRKAIGDEMYRAAVNATYTVDSKLADLLRRPAMRKAMERAKTVAENEGRQFSFDVESSAPFAGVGGAQSVTSRQVTGQGLQDLKMAMDEMLTDPQSGFAGQAGNAVRNLSKELIRWMETANPQFKAARESYKAASQPINQMDIGKYLLDRLQPASGAVGENAGKFGQALRDPDAVAKAATGFEGARFDQVMSPAQKATIDEIQRQLTGVVNAQNLGRAVGSNTGQNFVSQNFLRQVLGPTGLPQSWSESALLETLVRPIQFVGKAGEQRVTPKIAEGLLSPKETARLLEIAERRGLLERAAPDIARYLPATGLLGLPAY